MPRNASGTFSFSDGNFITGTTISSSVMNTKLNDLGAEITDSLSRSAEGGMLAALRLYAGTSALPGLAFTDETTLGFYRAASGDFRAASNGTDLLTIKAAGLVTGRGLTITQANSNTAGLTVTGAGTGDGLVSTGGATGDGGTFSGGATSGRGLVVTGTGSNKSGIEVTASSDSKAIEVTTGAQYGLYARAGIGLDVVASSGVGGSITGGTSSVGLIVANGTAATGGTRQDAMTLTNGDLNMSGVTDATSTTALTNRLAPGLIPKAWAHLTTTGGGSNTVTVNAGQNIASSSAAGGTDLTVTLAASVDSTPAIAVLSTNSITGLIFSASYSAGVITIRALDASSTITGGVPLDLWDFKNEGSMSLQVIVMATQ